jgi:xanthine dehydrogenase YagR molybdenum-binding subunit
MGFGEMGMVGRGAAVGTAVHDATGIRIRDLPITPERLAPALMQAADS